MKKKILSLLIVGSFVLCMCGCDGQTSVGNNPSNPDVPTQEEETEPSIFDNVIAGEAINELGSLFDFTSVLELENFELISACPLSENELLALYSGTEMSQVMVYDVSSGKEKHKIEFEDIKVSENATINSFNDKFAYIMDFDNNIIIYMNPNRKNYEVIELKEIPDSIVVVDEGEQLYYTMEDDCNIYQYTRETGNKMSVFDAADIVDSIKVKYVIVGSNTLIVEVTSDNYNGYATLSLEMQEITPMDEMEGELLYNGDEYLYKSPDKNAAIIIYDPMTPRLMKEFRLENKNELSDIRLFKDTPYIMSKVTDDKETILRLYNLDKGIMENILTLDAAENIADIKFYSVTNNVMIRLEDGQNSCKILIWNTQIIDSIIE